MLDRYQLRYFLAVVDQGNFSRAAQQCNVSQPTLSVGIAKLERDVGAVLFLRSSQRVQLTQAGTRLLTHARRIENEFNSAIQAVTGATDNGVIRIGILRSIAGSMIGAAMAMARQLDASARIELIEGTERELISNVAQGRTDCALTLVGRGGDRFLEEPLLEEGYALAVAVDHHAAGVDMVAAESLAGDVMIVRRHCEALSETSRHFTERGVRPHFAFRSTNDERVLQQVAAGLGITVMPDSYHADHVMRPRLAGFDMRRTIGILYGAGAEALSVSPPAVIMALRRVFSAKPGLSGRLVTRI